VVITRQHSFRVAEAVTIALLLLIAICAGGFPALMLLTDRASGGD
jgi:hypothetical protein